MKIVRDLYTKFYTVGRVTADVRGSGTEGDHSRVLGSTGGRGTTSRSLPGVMSRGLSGSGFKVFRDDTYEVQMKICIKFYSEVR